MPIPTWRSRKRLNETSDTHGSEPPPPHRPGPGAPADTLQRAARASKYWIVRSFRRHLALFCALNAALTIANILNGPPWWALWPLLVTGLAIGVHYLLYKALSVDESWAEERVEELNLKSYDRSHIEELKSRYGERSRRRPPAGH